MKTYGGSGGIAPPFLVSALDAASRLCYSTPGTHWIGGLEGPRAGLDVVEKRKISSPYRGSNTGRPARRSSLHRLHLESVVLTEVDEQLYLSAYLTTHFSDRATQTEQGSTKVTLWSYIREVLCLYLGRGFPQSLPLPSDTVQSRY
jgi:hypothetical protein